MKKGIGQRRMEEWLGGLTLNEKIAGLEKGKFYQCVRCDTCFFDKETFEEREWFECNSDKLNHECVEGGNYIVLKRGFEGIMSAIFFENGKSIEDLIFDYFN